MAAITVVLVDDGERASAVRALAQRWTRAGLLEPSLWVTVSGITDAPGPPIVNASVLEVDRTSYVDLFEYIGRQRLDLVRVVVGHLLVPGGDSAVALATAGRRLADAVAAALPRQSEITSGTGCRLHRSVAIVPVSGASDGTADVLQPDWDANVVVSPEDRADVDRSSVFVRFPGNLDGHAALALAAIGGVVAGVDAGAVDELVADATSREGEAVVVRISVRTVIGEDVVDRVTAGALDLTEVGPGGPARVVGWARPASRPDLVAQAAADHVLAQPEWAPTPAPEVVVPKRQHEGLLHAVRRAAVFNIKTVGAVTSWALSRGRAGVERGATEAIVGARAGVLVTLGPRPVSDLTRASDRLLERERTRLDDAMRLDATRSYAPLPSTWTMVRSLAFGLADGGELDGYPEPRQAGRRELLPPSAVVVSPAQAWSGLDGVRIRADDPRTMRDYTTTLAAGLAEAEAELTVAQAALESAETERADSEKRAAEATRPTRRKSSTRPLTDAAAPPEAPEGDGKARAEAPPAITPDDATMSRLRLDVVRWENRMDLMRTEGAAFKEWFEAQSAALLWKVADDVGSRAREMNERREKLESRLGRQRSAPSAALKKAQSGLNRWWIGTSTTWAFVVVLAVYGHFHGPTGSPVLDDIRFSQEGMWRGIEAATAVALLVLAWANHRFYKAVRHYEWRVEQLLAQLTRDKAEYVHVGHEHARLELLYEGLADWSQIIGEAVHRPWAPVDRPKSDVPDDVLATLPAALAVARQPRDSAAVPRDVVVAAMNVIYQPGWCSRLFDVAYEAWEGEQAVVKEEGYRTVDLDALDSPLSPRRRLREHWVSGAAQRVVSRRARRTLLDAVREGDLILPERVVERLGRYSDGAVVTEGEFLRPTAMGSVTFSTDVFSAAAQQMRRHYVETSVAWMPAAARVETSTDLVEVRPVAGSTALRLDRSRRVAVADLQPFQQEILEGNRALEHLLDDVDTVAAWH